MEREELKKAEIKDGKILLEGKVVEVENVLKVSVIKLDVPHDPREKWDETLEKELKKREVIMEKPEGANVYVVGDEYLGEHFPHYHLYRFGANRYFFPILYLRIKEENK